MKDKLFNNKNKLVLLVSLLLILIRFYIVLIIINYKSVDKYQNVILPNIYIEEFDMGGYSYENSYKKIRKQIEISPKEIGLAHDDQSSFREE